MALIGFVVVGDVPESRTIAGAAVVLASGLYLFHRERAIAKRVSAA